MPGDPPTLPADSTASKVLVVDDQEEILDLTATVVPLGEGRPVPRGSVTFFIDGAVAGGPVQLDGQGRASFTTNLGVGNHELRASYAGDRGDPYHPSTSPDLAHSVEPGAGVPGDETGPDGRRARSWLWILLLILFLIAIAVIFWWT